MYLYSTLVNLWDPAPPNLHTQRKSLSEANLHKWLA